MGGDATFSGTSYQAKLIALVYAHVLTQSRLGWLDPIDDTPVGVSGESGGPGDDIRIELSRPHPAVEVQAKHGLNAGARLIELLSKVLQRTVPGSEERVVLAVNRDSSRKVHVDFARDLTRIRAGRTDGLKQITLDVLQSLPDAASLLARVTVVTVDLDEPSNPESKLTLRLLESGLEDPTQVMAAWSVLVADANEVCARRLRRTRKELVDLLKGASIKVKPPRPDEKWFRQLEFTKRLVNRRHSAAALKALSDLEQELKGKQVDPTIWYRLFQHRAVAYLHLDRHEDALRFGLRALDFDGRGVDAHQTVALAAMMCGKLDQAYQHADLAVSTANDDEAGWLALAQVEAARGDDRREPPAPVAESPAYRAALAQIAVNQAEWERAVELTGAILDSGTRAPEVLFLRIQALLGMADRNQSIDPCDEVERICTELIDVIGDEFHPLSAKALVMRGTARRMLGKAGEAAEDLEHARELIPQDPELIAQTARACIDAGDHASATEVLKHPTVAESPMLLCLRASLCVDDQPGMARADLDACLRLLSDSADPNHTRVAAADVAICLDDLDLAERLLRESSPGAGPAAAWYSVQWGRLAFKRKEPEQGTKRMREAIERDPDRRADLLTELASHLRTMDHLEDAAGVLKELGPEEMTEQARRILLGVLIELHRLPEAQELVDALAAGGALPEWALQASVEIALRQEDRRAAVDQLMELVRRPGGARGVRFELARQLVAQARMSEAAEHVEVLRKQQDLSPTQSMLLAQLMHAVQPSQDALDLAFRAFRAGPADPELHRAFISLSLMSGIGPKTPEVAGPDTHVTLSRDEGETRSYTIFTEPPIDPLRGEISVDDAEQLGLVGAQVGDVLRFHQGTWREEEWTVRGILTAAHHAVQDAMLHYEDRFPSEPFFLARYSIGDGTSVKDFAPLIASAEEHRMRVGELVESYESHVFPLGMLSRSLRASIPDLLAALGLDQKRSTRVFVEWSNREGLDGSVRSARAASQVVLTSSALWSIVDLDLLDLLHQRYSLVAPSSLEAELKLLVAQAQKELEEGRKRLGTSEDGMLTLDDIEPGHAALKERLENRRALLDALALVDLHPRPLETIGPPDSQDEQLRSIIGPPSLDAVRLAGSMGLPLVADDLGLRKIARQYAVEDSFSSIAFLLVLADTGLITAADRDSRFLTLVMRGYAFIPPSVAFIARTLGATADLGQAGLAGAFNLLGSPLLELGESARIVSQVLKGIATSTIQVESVGAVVRLSLQGMASRWPPHHCAHAVVSASTEALVLLPDALRDVRLAAASFVKDHRG